MGIKRGKWQGHLKAAETSGMSMMQVQYALWEAKQAKVPEQIHVERLTPKAA